MMGRNGHNDHKVHYKSRYRWNILRLIHYSDNKSEIKCHYHYIQSYENSIVMMLEADDNPENSFMALDLNDNPIRYHINCYVFKC